MTKRELISDISFFLVCSWFGNTDWHPEVHEGVNKSKNGEDTTSFCSCLCDSLWETRHALVCQQREANYLSTHIRFVLSRAARFPIPAVQTRSSQAQRPRNQPAHPHTCQNIRKEPRNWNKHETTPVGARRLNFKRHTSLLTSLGPYKPLLLWWVFVVPTCVDTPGSFVTSHCWKKDFHEGVYSPEDFLDVLHQFRSHSITRQNCYRVTSPIGRAWELQTDAPSSIQTHNIRDTNSKAAG